MKSLPLFLYRGSVVSHQEVWLLLLDVLMKAALAIKSHGPGHSFSLRARISSGFTGMERSRPSVRLTEESSALAIVGLPLSYSLHLMHDSSITHRHESCKSWVMIKAFVFTIFTRKHTHLMMSDVTWLLSKFYCAAYLSHCILISD